MYKIFVVLFGIIFFTSCSKNLPDVGGTSAQKVANEWWVKLLDGTTDVGNGYHKILTYNTAANKDSIWVDDDGNLWDFKVRAKVDYNALTFATTQAQNEYYNIKVDITGGKVLVGTGRTKSGNVTDSIYMQVKFTDDPATTYTILGHARTGFFEDEY